MDSSFNMNTQNIPQKTVPQAENPAKRKRGRPRKDDDNVVKRRRPQVPITPAPAAASDLTGNILSQQQAKTVNPNTPRIDHDKNVFQVGQTVSVVIEGSFDAGYFIAVRADHSSSILRGVVFKPGCFVPVTPANDIAPHAKMYQRAEFGSNLQNPANFSAPQTVQDATQPVQLVGHSVVPIPFGQQHFRPPVMQQVVAQKDLRLVEQDDVMQVFEVSKPSDGPTIDSGAADNANLVIGSENHNTAMEISDQGFQEMKSPSHDDPKEALLDGTSHSADCMPKSNELLQEINRAHLEAVSLEEGEAQILTKDGTFCRELAVEESGFQERSVEAQVSTSATQNTELDFVVEDPAAQPAQD